MAKKNATNPTAPCDFQPNEDQWKCPKCMAGIDQFGIDYPIDEMDDCLLRNGDTCRCYSCHEVFTGEEVSKALAKLTAATELPPGHLKAFTAELRKQIDRFEMYWLTEAGKNKRSFPMVMDNPSEWWEQFIMFAESEDARLPHN